MKSLLEQVSGVDNLHRQLQKMESKMRSGQFIEAWKDCTRLIAALDRAKIDLIKAKEESEDNDI